MPFTPDEIEADILRFEIQQGKRLAAAYLAHPDPRDPDWPGHWVEERGEKQADDEEEGETE